MAGNVIAQKIQEDLKTAVKAQDKPRVSALRMVLSALKNTELEEREELSDEKELAVIASYARRIKESIEEFRKAERAGPRREGEGGARHRSLLSARADERRGYPPRGRAGDRRYRRRERRGTWGGSWER